ncbi:hypothetical protein [Haloarcula rubripromontorii]|uniref:hypothetical protein n=1 Tax=Haloarcula rubripromontorii TaxID=1705562 RepID=UPI000B302761|nr:hypothetical protein [Haloarcula rubripromontorii]
MGVLEREHCIPARLPRRVQHVLATGEHPDGLVEQPSNVVLLEPRQGARERRLRGFPNILDLHVGLALLARVAHVGDQQHDALHRLRAHLLHPEEVVEMNPDPEEL